MNDPIQTPITKLKSELLTVEEGRKILEEMQASLAKELKFGIPNLLREELVQTLIKYCAIKNLVIPCSQSWYYFQPPLSDRTFSVFMRHKDPTFIASESCLCLSKNGFVDATRTLHRDPKVPVKEGLQIDLTPDEIKEKLRELPWEASDRSVIDFRLLRSRVTSDWIVDRLVEIGHTVENTRLLLSNAAERLASKL